ncbi:unnamed protein product, partial [Effrenium voratum]
LEPEEPRLEPTLGPTKLGQDWGQSWANDDRGQQNQHQSWLDDRYVYKYGLDRVMQSHKIIRRDKHDHDEESDADEDIAILEQNLLDVDLNARKT